jgi:hypothetical protein
MRSLSTVRIARLLIFLITFARTAVGRFLTLAGAGAPLVSNTISAGPFIEDARRPADVRLYVFLSV